jgi:hypothetical protein
MASDRTLLLCLSLVVAASVAPGCTPETCELDADCAAGARCVVGTCAAEQAVPPESAPPDDDETSWPEPPAAASLDDVPDAPPAEPPVGEEPAAPDPACALGDEGIHAAQLPTPLGQVASWIQAGSGGVVSVDLDGEPADDGVLVWDLSAEHDDDLAVDVALTPLAGTWFADAFEGASYASPFTPDDPALLGVYRRAPDGLYLLGYASAAPDVTLVRYHEPTRVLALPLLLGLAESQATTATGTYAGNPWFTSEDSFVTLVDAQGRVRTPAGTFEVLRLRTAFESRVAVPYPPFVLVTASVRYTFVAPCLGPVAVVTRADDDAEGADSLARLGLLP